MTTTIDLKDFEDARGYLWEAPDDEGRIRVRVISSLGMALATTVTTMPFNECLDADSGMLYSVSNG